MRQVLFYIPFTEGWLTPQGVPLYGFGVMLLVTFALVLAWGGKRTPKVGLPAPRAQDLALLLFLAGIVGARLLYMVQYRKEMALDQKTAVEIALEFFKIWEGGIVVYGAVPVALLAYLWFRQRVLKPLGVNGWMLADAVAPLLAVGMAVGRIACFMNGCCWGQVVCEECQPVPLSADLGRFPLLPAHARRQLVPPPADTARLPHIHGLQTTAGFALRPRDLLGAADPRAVVAAVEPGSAAAAAGLLPGDRVVGVDGKPNLILLIVPGDAAAVERAKATAGRGSVVGLWPGGAEFGYESFAEARADQVKLKAAGFDVTVTDSLDRLVREWPRGQNGLELEVDRAGTRVPLRFVPRTVTFYPTQIYETVSMLLLTGVLLAFQPLRRHDGQVMVLFMFGYAAHRFLNEAIRIEPAYALGLTLSQWISVAIGLSAVGLELYLRLTQPKLPPGEVPLGYRAAA